MERTDGIGTCSITVHLRQTEQVSGGGILFEACRVGSVNESDGRMILNWDLGELTCLRPSVSTERVTGMLSRMLFGGGTADQPGTVSAADVEIRNAMTSENGTCTFYGLDEGAWLIHAADSSSYGKIEDTLVAVPCYVQEGAEWIGPVYNPDIWMKGDILQDETGEPQSEEPQSEKPQTEKPQLQTEKPAGQTQKQVPPPQRQDNGKNSPGTQPPPARTQQETAWEKTKQTENEQTRAGREAPKKPEREKKSSAPVSQTTSQSTPVVRTLDDTPLSSLLSAFFGCAVVIGILLVRLRKTGRTRIAEEGKRAGGGSLDQSGSGGGRRNNCILLLAAWTGMLLSLGLPVRAQAGEASAVQMTEGERKILFINESPSAPCLTVAKEVLNAENGSRAPSGDVFTFRLALDLERASGVRYRLFDETGGELADMTGDGQNLVPLAAASGDLVPFRTGRDGSFTLRAGQYALFEDVSVGELWEVSEQADEHYERVVPKSSDSLSGTVGRNGTHAQFVNRYVPEEDPGQSEGTAEITKQILWPEDCELPERGSFQIRVLVDGAAWKDAPVEIRDLENDTRVEDTRTDENGIFTIRGEERAILRSLPAGSDLRVEEIDDSGDSFVPSGESVWKGAVSSGTRVTFTNRLADFVVTKSLRSGHSDHRFLFSLLDRDGRPWSQVPYYLADEEGNLEQDAPEYTDTQGHFTLRSGERAVFAGMEEGAVYSIREETVLGYRQVTPGGREGYRGLRVRNGIPSLLFENETTNIKLFVPSTGGQGIILLLAVSMAGMLGCLILIRLRLHGKR